MNYIHTLLILGTKPHSASDVASHIKAADTVWGEAACNAAAPVY